MATRKPHVNEALLAITSEAKPKNPVLSSADKSHLRGLRRRGFTEPEIIEIAVKAGFQPPVDLFAQKKKPAL